MPAIYEWAKKHWVWIAGAAAILVLLVYIRNKQASAAEPTGDGGGGFGAGATAGSAPATDYTGQNTQSQLDQLQLQAGQANLEFQKAMNQLYLQGEQQQLAIGAGTQQSTIDLLNQVNLTNAAHEKELGHASADFCPAGTSMRLDPNSGQYVCRNKSGGFAFIGQISSAVQNIFSGLTSGAASAAPGVGAGVLQGAANYYSGRLFGAPSIGQQAYPGSPYPGGGGTIVAPPTQYNPGQMSGGYTPGISGNTVKVA